MRFILVHKLLIQLDPQICSNLIKCHVLTGAYSTSNVGTKSAVLQSDPNKYLQNFGQIISWK